MAKGLSLPRQGERMTIKLTYEDLRQSAVDVIGPDARPTPRLEYRDHGLQQQWVGIGGSIWLPIPWQEQSQADAKPHPVEDMAAAFVAIGENLDKLGAIYKAPRLIEPDAEYRDRIVEYIKMAFCGYWPPK